ncbi:hypothetical protein A3K73_05790 [Candidatus Pacearchaeota archaeon RBG_13_36_9]|nr:MAG: hypothetical protein A3K73_05790 [Candidatus Pacearchaeota archaeon RBG_13_36_9]
MKEIRECFESARKDEAKGKKHKGLLIVEPSQKKAEGYLDKARDSLRFCEIYKNAGADYKIPEEWYYSLYYCALAILCKFGIETRSQRCTALFVKYAKEKELIEYDDEFIKKIMVYKEKENKSAVDEREEARYGPSIKIKEVEKQYAEMMDLCKRAISQAQDIVLLEKKFEVPKELL